MKFQIIALLFLVLLLAPTDALISKSQKMHSLKSKQKKQQYENPAAKNLAQMKAKSKHDASLTADNCLAEYDECKDFSDEIFESYDNDESGSIDIEEFSYVAMFVAGVFELPPPTPEDVQTVLDVIDLDASGCIDKDEFFNLFLAVIDEMAKQGPGPSPGQGQGQGGPGGNGGGNGGANSKHPGKHSKTTKKQAQQKRMLKHEFAQMKNKSAAKAKGYLTVDWCLDNYDECKGYSDEIFSYFDQDATGQIDKVEFEYVATYICGSLDLDPPSVEELDEFYGEVDLDDSGEIDSDEFFNIVLAIIDETGTI